MFEEGRRCYLAGYWPEDNPFHPESADYADWMEGYLEAEADQAAVEDAHMEASQADSSALK